LDTKIITRTDLSRAASASGEACLVQIYGPELGRRFVLAGAVVAIGRGEDCDIVVELDNVSRRHCSVLTRGGEVYLRDESSTNGTFLNDLEARGETRLSSGDLIKVGSAIFKFLHGGGLGSPGSIEAQYHEEIYRLTIVDGLTQIYNKRYLLEFLDRELARCGRHGRPLSLLLFDIDHFKRVNDGFGHLAGDFVLREFAAQLKASVRREECLARYGGEEFALVLPETGRESALLLAEKLRKRIEGHAFVHEGARIDLTCSGGLSSLDECRAPPATEGVSKPPLDPPAFLKAADDQLYRAKREGRNRIAG
jgi:two-component system, cell cycle response regulator